MRYFFCVDTIATIILIGCMKKFFSKMHWRVATALIIAAIMACILRSFELTETQIATKLLEIAEFIGKFFMRMLSMIIVPLVATSVVCGSMNLGKGNKILSVGLKTILFYTITGIIAIVLSLFIVNLVAPGSVDVDTAKAIVGNIKLNTNISAENVKTSDMVLKLFPPNIFDAATDNTQLLGLIVFAVIYGIFKNALPEKYAQIQRDFWDSANMIFLKITDFIMKFLPIGVFGLTFPVFARAGIQTLGPVASFFLCVVAALFLHTFGSMSIILASWKIPPFRHIKTMLPALLTAFSTSSSVATLPVTLDCVENGSKISKDISGFTIPLGATINMNGSALYECMAVMFISQICVAAGICQPISIEMQIMIVLLALLTSVGVAGIPSASLVAIALIMGVAGIPTEAIGIIWITDRILDMMRTATNIYGDTCAAVWVAKTTKGTQKPYQD